MLFAGAGMFGIFLLLIYYLQVTLGYSPVVTGLAVLPMVAVLMVSAMAAQVVLMPRTGPKPLVGLGMLTAAAGMVWLTGIGVHSGYATAILGPASASGRARTRPGDRSRGEHRHVRHGALRRRRGFGHHQREPAAWRLDRHGAA